ncbi:MAG: hypothetical protein L0Y60_09850 [Beijerinckiaceae bacterium]|nr:hypothetical protein [Beijerinckiaceae bacterium]
MSISPVSDIVLDVARAADPAKARAAAERLSTGDAAGGAGSSGFGHALAKSATSLPVSLQGFSGPGSSFSMVLHQTDARTKAYKGLEQLVLKNLVETMLPKEPAALRGSGTASDIWRSLLADQLASEIAKCTNLGAAHQHTVTIDSTTAPAQTRWRSSAISPVDRSLDKDA